jgi:nucleoside-diphosphate-sugar epimerase
MVAKPVLAGKRAVVAVPPDQPHSFTSVNDAAAALITVAGDERAWGSAWHAPTDPPSTLRQLAARFAEVTGAPPPRLTAIPYPALWTARRVRPDRARTTHHPLPVGPPIHSS